MSRHAWPKPVGARRSAFSILAQWIAAIAAAIVLAAPAASARPTGYVVTDAATGVRLAGKRDDEKMHPASLTKMMTLYLVFEAVANGDMTFDDAIVASHRAAGKPPSKLGLRAGKTITVRDAVRAAAVFSANDAAAALAEAVAGTERAFAARMTRRARELGMYDTTFRNATGLTQKGHLSTPADMAILARRLMTDFPRNYIVFARKSVTVHGRTRNATNRLLRLRKGVDGVKTGFTSAAGYNLAATAKRGDERVIVTVFGGNSAKRRDRQVLRLLDLGFERLARPIATDAAPRPKRRPLARARDLIAQDELIGDELLVTSAPAKSRSVVSRGDRRRDDRAVIASARPRLDPRGQTAAARPPIGWSVQVGAYRGRAMAAERLEDVAALDAPALSAATALVQRASLRNTLYRARFAGLDKRKASDACRWLSRRRVDCMPVPPNGWGG